MSETYVWGTDPELDCENLLSKESQGEYPEGHHDMFCPVHSERVEAVAPAATITLDMIISDLPETPREENTDGNEEKLVV